MLRCSEQSPIPPSHTVPAVTGTWNSPAPAEEHLRGAHSVLSPKPPRWGWGWGWGSRAGREEVKLVDLVLDGMESGGTEEDGDLLR